ncbi:tRNA-(ms[2]io[6]A)-hydroxylase [Planctobacterium marinum]|uniref:tRNA-(ms[2]io[6]A)-hydroxylase n=1 Tax=Planctobacterium marinum TaxID=1631968 RepID=UPI001E29EF06|nr:tRNA-(ms[2]io[6]A)-hydroxylase [Planctobacterium marinum]MCC2607954.1 tRNA-(ms[2]io[6]A)-hydroxylase [Planctobacterium marinum]
MFDLKYKTPFHWTEAVLADFDTFLIDHAAAEKKASGMAMSMLSHYPDKEKLVKAMVNLSIEEMTHFRQVIKILYDRGLTPGSDTKDEYVNQFRQHFRKGTNEYMLDRLLIGGIIEARGCERFGLVSQALPKGPMKNFYRAIAESEADHQDLFVELAMEYFPEATVQQRLEQLLEAEAKIIASIPHTAALH